MGAAERHHTAALAQVLVERLFPLGAGGYAVVRVEIQEQRLVAVAAQVFAHPLGPVVVLRAVADEEGGHGRLPRRIVSLWVALAREDGTGDGVRFETGEHGMLAYYAASPTVERDY